MICHVLRNGYAYVHLNVLYISYDYKQIGYVTFGPVIWLIMN